ncbi:flagellar basal body rod C-terminal domain-containing protein [Rheinheimera aquimaris]|jgi:flagellar basal body rod protein FlgG|uniref:flagellar basal body rod C-terminal domain-containing protein n=1 Tax=Rheinheimera aquimaris TaxID=412437 RepID=UPI001066E838|nr:flagellar basal body rod C-terminal domain-containing protein [Rheinheimera aquimaris]MCD1600365.1 hypothetical protein [Rheinheimera aquimaris]|tara:strand:+ start:6044 stop:6709 length:666 start_codon:yes stop_codon:yes gene_type:complete
METIQLIDAALNRDLQHLNRVSQNVANINSGGYLAVESFDHVLAAAPQQYTNIKPAAVRETGRRLDFAILGDAFFRVQLGSKEYLSRNGHFHINEAGYLAHVSGGLVLGENGPIAIKDDTISLAADGWIMQAGTPLTKLSLSNAKVLRESVYGQGLYEANTHHQTADNYTVKMNAINTSNVNSSAESIRMMELSRHIQSLQKAAAAYDQMLNSGINEIGKR